MAPSNSNSRKSFRHQRKHKTGKLAPSKTPSRKNRRLQGFWRLQSPGVGDESSGFFDKSKSGRCRRRRTGWKTCPTIWSPRRSLNSRARFCDTLGMPAASSIGVAGKAPNGAGFDSPGRSEAKPWVTRTTERKPQRGAIPIGRPSAGNLGPLGLFAGLFDTQGCALGYRISPHSGLRAQSGTNRFGHTEASMS